MVSQESLEAVYTSLQKKWGWYTWKVGISTEQNNNKNIVTKKYISKELYFMNNAKKDGLCDNVKIVM